MEIQVTVRQVYGVPTIYPANDAAKVLARIAGTRTLTVATLDLARELGMRVVDKTPAPSVLAKFKEAA